MEETAAATAAGIEGTVAAAVVSDPGSEASVAHTVVQIAGVGSAGPAAEAGAVHRSPDSKDNNPAACSERQVMAAAWVVLYMVDSAQKLWLGGMVVQMFGGAQEPSVGLARQAWHHAFWAPHLMVKHPHHSSVNGSKW